MKQSYKIVPILLLLFPMLFLPACVKKSVSDKLNDIDTLSESDPKSAITALSEIRPSELNEKDRKYYDLLCIKVDDKNYNKHSSDSLITGVLEYFNEHPDEDKYAEVLYYAGRVYSDIKDYPTALRYFEQALDTLRGGASDVSLRTAILSQSARLQKKQGLNEEGISNIEECIIIEEQHKDSLNLMFDYELLGQMAADSKDYGKSDYAYKKALDIARRLNNGYVYRETAHLAALKEYEEKYDSAVMLIRGIPDKIDSLSKPMAIARAAGIYFHAGIPDTAAMYAKQLITLGDVPNLKNAYYYLSNPRLRDYVPKDSISSYIDKYQYSIVR